MKHCARRPRPHDARGRPHVPPIHLFKEEEVQANNTQISPYYIHDTM